MPASDTTASNPPSTTYLATEQERVFIDGALTPNCVEIGQTFDAEVEKLWQTWEQGLASEFATI